MTRPTFFEDVEAVVAAMRSGGMAAAQAKYHEIVKERKLVKWEELVYREKVQETMRHEGLWNPMQAQPAPQTGDQTVKTDQSPVKE